MNIIALTRVLALLVVNAIVIFVLLYLLQVQSIQAAYESVSNRVENFFMQEKAISLTQTEKRAEELALLEMEKSAAINESQLQRENELALKEMELGVLEEELNAERALLAKERMELINERQRSEELAREENNYEQKLLELADRFYSMPPEQAAERILALGEDVLIIDVLSQMDTVASGNDQISIVPFLLSLMPAEDSARILKKSTVDL